MSNKIPFAHASFGAFVVSAAMLAGCGSSSGYPACQEHKTVFSGTLGGASVDETLSNESTMLTQLGSPATLKLTFFEGGHLNLEWSGMVADGQDTTVSGELKLPNDNARSVGAGSTLVILADDAGYQLDLKFGGADELMGCSN